MQNFSNKPGSKLGFSCLILLAFLKSSNAGDINKITQSPIPANKKLASQLMYSLNKKVTDSLMAARAKPLLPADPSRLTIQCLDDEFQFQDIQRDVILPWQASWKSKDLSKFQNLVTKDFSSQKFADLSKEKSEVIDGILHTVFRTSGNLAPLSKSLSDYTKFVGNFKKISFAEMTADKYISAPAGRSSGQVMNKATVLVRYDLRGEGLIEKKLEVRGLAKVEVNRVNGTWKLSKVELLSSERLAVNQNTFENITTSSKVAELVPSHLRREAIRRGGYALAVEEHKEGQNSGLFVATVAETVLLKGNNNLTFSKTETGTLSKQTLVKSAAFADLTNSGNQDLVIVRFAPNESQAKGDRSDIQIYKNENGNFSKREKVISFNKETAYAMPLAVGDFNNDSFLDFYIGFPGAKDFTTLGKAVHNKELTTEGVFYNQKNGTFKDDPYKSFAKAHGNVDDLSKIFPHSALAVDFNQDRKLDLVVIDDRGNLSPLYINKGEGNFEASSTKIGVGLMDYGMGVDVGDLNGDGKLDFVMSSVNFNSSKRIIDSCSTNWSVETTISAGTAGLRVFQANKNSTFTETTEQNGLSWSGEGAGGVKVFDYNNDGFPDIYLTTGLWSGSEKDNSQDITPYFVAASTLGFLEDGLKSGLNDNKFVYDKVVANNDFKGLLFNSDSQSSIMDLLSFYRGDLSGKNPSKINSSLSLAGNQPNRLFRNNGNGTYTEVGFLVGVDSVADGYMPATASLGQDGNLDLILRNADPGYDVKQHSPVEIFKNLGKNGNKSLTLKLRGSTSNKDAVGAQVEGRIGSKIFIGQVLGNSGTVQSERIIHFGLGHSSKMDSLKIIWPSGKIQNFVDVSSGFHFIDEGDSQIAQN
jgi:hypothetical protein